MARLRAGHARPLQSGYYKVAGMKNPTAGVVVGETILAVISRQPWWSLLQPGH